MPSHQRAKRLAISALADSPPTTRELNEHALCRQLQRSRGSILALSAELAGSWTELVHELGYELIPPPHRSGFQHACWWITAYLKEWERVFYESLDKIMSIDLPELRSKMTEQAARALGIPVDFLADYAENRDEVKQFVEDMRGDLVIMAELQLMKLISEGHPASIQFALRNLSPHYRDMKGGGPPPPTDVVIRYEDGPNNYHAPASLPQANGNHLEQEAKQSVAASSSVREDHDF